MTYVIKNTVGTTVATVIDGSINNQTDIPLSGRDLPNYGQPLNTALVKLLENSANTVAPGLPITGELWYDTATSSLKVYNNQWSPVNSIAMTTLVNQPESLNQGTFWYNTSSNQLYVYDSGYNLIGPEASAGFSLTRLTSTVVTDTNNLTHPVILGNINNTTVFIIANYTSAFTLNSISAIPGFTVISPGINLLPGFNVVGNATTASKLQTPVLLNGVAFDGSSSININTNYSLTPGSYISGAVFNGSSNQTWSVNASSSSAPNSVVARDASGNFSANQITGNITTASKLQIPVSINNVSFDGSSPISVNTNYYLIPGSYISGSNFDGSSTQIWSVNASSSSTPNAVVARDTSGNFSANQITGNITTASNLASGSLNQIPVQTSNNTTGFISTPTSSNEILTYNGSTIVWGTITDVIGYTPVQQGGGIGQVSTKIYIGSDGTTGLKATVNGTDLGNFLFSSSGLPSGMISYFAMISPPTGWLVADGSTQLISAYGSLYSALGTLYGGNGVTTFGIPDLRGEFIRGWDNGAGIDVSRVFGSNQSDDLKSHSHTYQEAGSPQPQSGEATECLTSNTSANTGNTGGTETRPRNVALLACIKI